MHEEIATATCYYLLQIKKRASNQKYPFQTLSKTVER
jgi:hypothetical protein